MFGIAVVIAIVAVVIRVVPQGNAPAPRVGKVPAGYQLDDLANDGDSINLGATGPARIGGTVEPGAALVDVIVTGGGQTAHATIDRSVTPPVWWVFAAPPTSGRATFTVTSVGTDGSRNAQDITLDFQLPKDDDIVIHPEVVVLGSKGAPKLDAWDAGSGTVTMTGAVLGQVHQGTILASGIVDGVAEDGLLRRVTGYTGDAKGLRAQTEAITLDEAILQADVPDVPPPAEEDGVAPTGPGNIVHGRSRTSAESRAGIPKPDFTLGLGVGMPPGTKADAALDNFGVCNSKCTVAKPIKFSGKADPAITDKKAAAAAAATALKLELTASASVGLGVDINIRWDWDWFNSGFRGKFGVGITMTGAVASRLSLGVPIARSAIDPAAALLAATNKQLFSFKGSKVILDKSFTSITVVVLGVPIVFVPKIHVEAKWDGGVTTNDSVSAAGDFKLAGGLEWTDKGTHLDGDASGGGALRYNIGIVGSANVQFSISAIVLAYGSFGPQISTIAAGKTKLALGADSGRGPFIAGTFDVNVKGTVGVLGEVPIINKRLFDKDFTLFDRKLLSVKIEKYFNEADTSVEPGLPPPPDKVPDLDPVVGTDLAMLMLVDTSSSMADNDGNGVVKLDGAKSAMRTWLRTLPPSVRVGLRSYPAPGSDCDAGQRLEPLAPLNVDRLQAQIDALTPSGSTPTAAALTAALEDLPTSGKRTVVLISDGESNCDGDPCEVAKKLGGQGVGVETDLDPDITINSVGFQISDAGATQLQCIADATGGQFSTVDNSDDLSKQLTTLAGPVLTVQVDAPTTVKLDGNGIPASPVVVRAKVKNAGGRPATDVLVSLSAKADAEIADKGRPIGTIQPGESVSVEWPLALTNTGDNHNVDLTARAELLAGNPEDAVTDSATIGVVVEAGDRVDEVGPVLRSATRVAILGDSYSAGEGTYDYLDGTDTKGHSGQHNSCHRSVQTYGKRAFTDVLVLACSGAVTADLTTTSKEHTKVDGTDPLPSQVEQLDEAKGHVDAVLLTSGGNDIHFADIAAACLIGKKCALPVNVCFQVNGGKESCISSAADMLEKGLAGLTQSLLAGYAAIDDHLNNDERRAERSGRQAPIVVLAYPKLLPTNSDRQQNCVRGMSPEEIRMANRVVERLNSTIRNAVDIARTRRLPVYFAGSVERAFQGDPLTRGASHTLCDSTQFANDVSFKNPITPVVESLHPNVAGYEAMTDRMLDDARTWPVLPDAHRSNGAKLVTWTAGSLEPIGSSIAAGSAAEVSGDGFAPGTLVTAQIASTQITVGGGRSDAKGKAVLVASVPQWAEHGRHHLRLVGIDAKGNMRVIERQLEVTAPSWSRWWFVSGALLVVIVGLAIWLRRRRGRQSSAPPQVQPA
ncbi:MAG: VWA domain-containing protein [Acidimicrobiales bacterium]